MSGSLQPHGLQLRLLCPWDFPGDNTGVDCHFLFQRHAFNFIRRIVQITFSSSFPLSSCFKLFSVSMNSILNIKKNKTKHISISYVRISSGIHRREQNGRVLGNTHLYQDQLWPNGSLNSVPIDSLPERHFCCSTFSLLSSEFFIVLISISLIATEVEHLLYVYHPFWFPVLRIMSVYLFAFSFFGNMAHLAGSQFPDQELNLGHS